jgi:protease II
MINFEEKNLQIIPEFPDNYESSKFRFQILSAVRPLQINEYNYALKESKLVYELNYNNYDPLLYFQEM